MFHVDQIRKNARPEKLSEVEASVEGLRAESRTSLLEPVPMPVEQQSSETTLVGPARVPGEPSSQPQVEATPTPLEEVGEATRIHPSDRSMSRPVARAESGHVWKPPKYLEDYSRE